MKQFNSPQLIEFMALLLQEVLNKLKQGKKNYIYILALQIKRQRGTESRSSLEMCLFVSSVCFLYQEPLPLSHVKKMQEIYQLNSVRNAEVRFR